MDEYERAFRYGVTFGVLLLLLIPLGISAELRGADYGEAVVVGLASWILPAAMGFLLVLSCGGVDLSVWVVMGLGGVTAAGLINLGVSPGFAFLAAVALGAGIGGINGLLAARIGFPSILVTAVTALAGMGVIWAMGLPRVIGIPDQTFDAWVSVLNDGYTAVVNAMRRMGGGAAPLDDVRVPAPLMMLRMLLVAGVWSAVLLVLLWANRRRIGRGAWQPSRRWVLFASLCGSGALSALAGVCWVLDNGQAPIPTRLVDSLTIPVAVVLGGGLILRGRGQTVLACIFLPAGVLLTGLWCESIFPIQVWGFSLQLLLLGVIALEVQWAFLWCLGRPRPRHWWGWFPGVLSAVGLGVLGCSALVDLPPLRAAVGPQSPGPQSIGVALWALGAILLLIQQSAFCVLRARRGTKQSGDP